MSNVFTAGRGLNALDLTRLAAAIDGTYGIPASAGGAVTVSSGMTVAVSAITGGVATINGTLVATAYAGGTVTLDASDPTNPRIDSIYYDTAGAVDNATGTAIAVTSTTGPVPPTLSSTQIRLADIYVAAGATSISSGDITDRRQQLAVTPINTAVLSFVQDSGYKGFFALGAPQTANYADANLVGLGFAVGIAGSSTATDGATTNAGTWLLTGVSNYALVRGPGLYYQNDWTMVGRIKAASSSDQTIVFGAKANLNASDENNIIAFRVSATGNLIGVVDSGGTETTRDSGVTIATERTVRIEVREAGTIVRFYVDNVQVGADVTTNIPTAFLYCIVGVTSAASSRELYVSDVYGWREV